ncbi:MAG: hypothetical protein GY806_19790 [Gammaproteobacteria bacterium]|nr:hypothetical protein [Gammaproteobacteria bacterium]
MSAPRLTIHFSGGLIPSEPQLATSLVVSQGTVKIAIDNLVWENRD